MRLGSRRRSARRTWPLCARWWTAACSASHAHHFAAGHAAADGSGGFEAEKTCDSMRLDSNPLRFCTRTQRSRRCGGSLFDTTLRHPTRTSVRLPAGVPQRAFVVLPDVSFAAAHAIDAAPWCGARRRSLCKAAGGARFDEIAEGDRRRVFCRTVRRLKRADEVMLGDRRCGVARLRTMRAIRCRAGRWSVHRHLRNMRPMTTWRRCASASRMAGWACSRADATPELRSRGGARVRHGLPKLISCLGWPWGKLPGLSIGVTCSQPSSAGRQTGSASGSSQRPRQSVARSAIHNSLVAQTEPVDTRRPQVPIPRAHRAG